MDIRAEINKVLHAGLPDLNGRVYPIILPQDTTENAVVYRVINESENTCVEGNAYSTRCTIQIDVLCHTLSQSVDVMHKVKTLIKNNFNVNGLNTYETYEDHTLKYRQIIDFNIGNIPV